MMTSILRIVAALLSYVTDALKRRRDYDDSRLGELEELQQAASGDDEQSEQRMQSTFHRMRNRRRVGGNDQRV